MANANDNGHLNNGAKYFANICNIIYLAGFPSLWQEDLKYSKTFVKFYNSISKTINFTSYFFIIFEWAAYFTQHNLTEKQSSDQLLFNYSHPILFSYRLILLYHEEKIKEMGTILFVKLKDVYNDEEVEKKMIRKAKVFSISFLTLCSLSLVIYACDGILQTLTTGATFTTLITVWPDVDDRSTLANIARSIIYVYWWIFMTRAYGAYCLVLSLMVALEHQYKNLESYFESLCGIFDEDLSQTQKEVKYEEGLKVGIKLHSETIRCFRLAQDSCSSVYCLQILLNITVIVSLMTQMVNSERTVSVMFTVFITAGAILLCTGVFMWTAGDVTVEAAYLATAMYGSGWQNCYGRARSIRSLLTIAILQAQRPVVLKGLGIVTISYNAYLSIVRSSYSIFTVLY